MIKPQCWSALRRVALFGAIAACFTVPQSGFAQTAQFTGVVLADDAGEKPLANAEIVFPALNRSVRSDSAGNFLVSDLPLGKHKIIIRLLGYESIDTEITLKTARPPGVDLLLKPITTKLATVETKATATSPYAMRLVEFEDRKKTGLGKFLDATVFEKNDGRPMSSFLAQSLGGVRFAQQNGHRYMISLRGNGMANTNCYMQVVINGVVRYSGMGQPLFDVDEINSKDVIGFEYHTTASTPQQYNATRGSSCGTVIIWTK